LNGVRRNGLQKFEDLAWQPKRRISSAGLIDLKSSMSMEG